MDPRREQLLPERLKQLWTDGARDNRPSDELWREQQRLIGEYREIWSETLRLSGYATLKESLLAEIGRYTGNSDLDQIERRCRGAVQEVTAEWQNKGASASDQPAVVSFYDSTEAYIFDLMWWHTLEHDDTPLAYVMAMKFAEQHGCRRYLDFGAGVGSAGILFAKHGFEVSLADISTNLLRFLAWRFAQRRIAASILDLKAERPPSASIDLVTAMDVWEHLTDPVGAVDQIADTLVPGGFLFGRFAAEPDPNYPQHIVVDFEPTFKRLAERGFAEVWRDDWLWGHQAFQKVA